MMMDRNRMDNIEDMYEGILAGVVSYGDDEDDLILSMVDAWNEILDDVFASGMYDIMGGKYDV